MHSTVLTEIIAFLLGRKYYANIIATREAAEKHRMEIETTMSFRFVETVSFRSRKIFLDATVRS